MTALLDTNVFLWCIGGFHSRLSTAAKRIVEDDENRLLVSAASLWEIALKARAGKLSIPETGEFFREHLNRLGVEKVLPVEASHILGMFDLADHHRGSRGILCPPAGPPLSVRLSPGIVDLPDPYSESPSSGSPCILR